MGIRKRIEVVAAVICDGCKFFATQRGYGEWKDWWEFPGGKNCFISVDSRKIRHNPFYKALKAKSFTANDIMLHFFLLDILQPGEK